MVKDNNRLLGNRVVWKSNEIVSTLGECLVLKLEWNFFFVGFKLNCHSVDRMRKFFVVIIDGIDWCFDENF